MDLETTEHPHQRSVFIAVGDVNGIDFWNEDRETVGEQRHQGFDQITSGPAWGGFTAKNIWYDHKKGNALLDEKRTFTFYNQPDRCRYVDVETTFTASYCDVQFGNTKEAGPLGIRINEEMRADRSGSFINAYGARNEAECWGRPAPWCDYTGMVGGQQYGIAVFDHEDNERYPTTWHIRDYGLFAANNLYFKGGLKIPRHYSLTYKFRICFHENTLDTADRFLVYAR
ncbi:MAG: PmoA family protein [Bianqueaceae bacterium]